MLFAASGGSAQPWCKSRQQVEYARHVAKMSQTCFFQLGRLHQVQSLLGCDFAINIVTALMQTQLDYGNALIACLPYLAIKLLQHIINAATRLVYGLQPRNHITDTTIAIERLVLLVPQIGSAF